MTPDAVRTQESNDYRNIDALWVRYHVHERKHIKIDLSTFWYYSWASNL